MGKSLTKKLIERKRREAENAALNELAIEKLGKLCDQTDITILYALHEEFGFGRERLLRFYKAWLTIHMEMIERFRCIDGEDAGAHDGSDYLVMQRRLEEIGVTMEDLRAIASEEDRKYLKWRDEKTAEKFAEGKCGETAFPFAGKIL